MVHVFKVANLANYFGKAENVDDITVSPILIQKGLTKLALFGLGSVRDERLHRTFAQKQVFAYGVSLVLLQILTTTHPPD